MIKNCIAILVHFLNNIFHACLFVFMLHIMIYSTAPNYTYFVKGTDYWTFSNDDLEVVGSAKSFKKDWLRCGVSIPEVDELDGSGTVKVVVPVLVLLVILGLIVAFVVNKRRNSYYEKPVLASTTTTKPPRPPPYNPRPIASSHCNQPGQKTLFVSTAQQKLRWCKFSLQGQV